MLVIKRFNLSVLAILSCWFMQSANALDMVDEVQKCAAIETNDERLYCYDALSQTLVAAQSKNETVRQSVVQGTSAAEESSDMSDSIGGSRFTSEEERQKSITQGRVTFCQLSYDKKYLFIFENGQIWKQVKDKRYRLKECGFDVTISKDFFGYFMEIQGEAAGKTGKIRIKRIK
jgi:hypothetical protein